METNRIKNLLGLIDRYNGELFKVIPGFSQEPYKALRRYVAAFISATYQTEDISIRQADSRMFELFRQFLLANGYSSRTAHRTYRLLQRVIGSVDEKGAFVGNIVTRKYSAEYGYLTKQELIRILRSRMPGRRLEQVRDIFIFSCFTGLRHDDIMELTEDNVIFGEDGWMSIVSIRRMTDTVCHIPLLDIPRRIIEKHCGKEESLLPCISEQKTNDYLKELGRECGLSKKLCFSTAKNTYASTVTFANGLPTELIAATIGDNTGSVYEEMPLNKIDEIKSGFATLSLRLKDLSDIFVL